MSEPLSVSGELRLAILDMDKALGCLRYELSGSVWEDVARRWNAVRLQISNPALPVKDTPVEYPTTVTFRCPDCGVNTAP